MSKKDIAREEREWARAFALRKDLACYVETGFSSRGAVNDFCRVHDYSRSTAYRLLNLAKKDDSARCFIRRKPGRRRMSIGHTDEQEKIIAKGIRDEILNRNRLDLPRALKVINNELFSEGLSTVSLSTLHARVGTISDRVLKKKRYGGRAARQAFEIIKGRYEVSEPLAVVQIDHTLLDIMVVDPNTGECLGRPYLTVLIDIATGMPTGIFLSLDAPSAVNLMMAFHRSVFPKADYLASLGIPHEWPVHGIPQVISSDNGTDLKSKAFNLGLEHYGIDHFLGP